MTTRENAALISCDMAAAAGDPLRELERMKSEFAANVTHELRTPLNAIIGFTHLALSAQELAKQRKYLQNVQRSAQGLLAMINNILEISTADLRHAQHDLITFDFDTWLTDALKPFGEAARANELQLTTRVGRDVPFRLTGNAGRLTRILQLLCDNAVKFTLAGGISIQIDAQQDSADSVMLHFRVKDTGIGIAEDKQALLFTPFQQADGSLSRRYGGLGVGLALAKKLAASLDGDVGMESMLHVGSTFWFTARLGVPHGTPLPTACADTASAPAWPRH